MVLQSRNDSIDASLLACGANDNPAIQIGDD
jgi:hypothetical protein